MDHTKVVRQALQCIDHEATTGEAQHVIEFLRSKGIVLVEVVDIPRRYREYLDPEFQTMEDLR